MRSRRSLLPLHLKRKSKPPRPLTHDLFKNFADQFDILVKQVIIHKLVDGVFYSSIICERDTIEEIIDARTSDAIALALRFKAPIFTYKNILDKAGIYLKSQTREEDISSEEEAVIEELLTSDDKESVAPKSTEDFSKFSLKELNEMLDQAVAEENYEKAAAIRDEISKR